MKLSNNYLLVFVCLELLFNWISILQPVTTLTMREIKLKFLTQTFAHCFLFYFYMIARSVKTKCTCLWQLGSQGSRSQGHNYITLRTNSTILMSHKNTHVRETHIPVTKCVSEKVLSIVNVECWEKTSRQWNIPNKSACSMFNSYLTEVWERSLLGIRTLHRVCTSYSFPLCVCHCLLVVNGERHNISEYINFWWLQGEIWNFTKVT